MLPQIALWLLCGGFLLSPGYVAAQTSYNRWDARPPDTVSKPAKAKSTVAPKDTAAIKRFTMDDGKVVTIVCLPSFPGGDEAFTKYIDKKLRKPKGPQQHGTVRVTFIVLASGAVSGAHVKSGNGLTPAYDAALLEVVHNLPPFAPGGCNGNSRAMEMTLPYLFK